MDKLSALMDGELDEQQARRQLARIKQDEKLRSEWETFHLIGDLMRGERPLSGRFTEIVAERMEKEPTVLAPHRSMGRRVVTVALSVAASLSAVAAVGWIAFFSHPLVAPGELAKAPAAPPPVAAPSTQLASVPSDGKMSEYLIAHQEFSPSTAIQGLAPYIRSVSGTPRGAGH